MQDILLTIIGLVAILAIAGMLAVASWRDVKLAAQRDEEALERGAIKAVAAIDDIRVAQVQRLMREGKLRIELEGEPITPEYAELLIRRGEL